MENEKQLEISLPAVAEFQTKSVSLFGSKDAFEHSQRVAIMLSKSELVPATYQNNVGNCLIALEMAGRIGASPIFVMQNLYIVHGKPAWSSQFLIATLNASGKFSPLRYEESKDKGGSCRAWAIDLSTNEKLYGVWITMEMANVEGWLNKKGSKWQTMPDTMLRYRAASFFVRQFAPELSMGIYTQEEIQDIPFTEVSSKEELVELFEKKKELLKEDDIIHIERIINNNETQSYKKTINFLKSK